MVALVKEIRMFAQQVQASGINPSAAVLEFMQGKVMSNAMMDQSVSTSAIVSDMVQRYGAGNLAMAYSQLRDMHLESGLQAKMIEADALTAKLNAVAAENPFEHWRNPALTLNEAGPELRTELLKFRDDLKALVEDVGALSIVSARKFVGMVREINHKVSDCPYLSRACTPDWEKRTVAQSATMGLRA